MILFGKIKIKQKLNNILYETDEIIVKTNGEMLKLENIGVKEQQRGKYRKSHGKGKTCGL